MVRFVKFIWFAVLVIIIISNAACAARAVDMDVEQRYADMATLYAPIRFESVDASINQDYMDILADKALVLKEHPNLRLVIEGHCADNEPEDVGAARMIYVQDALLRLGVSYNQVKEIINYGSQYPVHEDGLELPDDPYFVDRRVAFVVLGDY